MSWRCMHRRLYRPMQKIMGTEWVWLFFLIFGFAGDENFKTIWKMFALFRNITISTLLYKSLFKQKYWAKKYWVIYTNRSPGKQLKNGTINFFLHYIMHLTGIGILPQSVSCDISCTAWNVAKYGVFSGPYFPAFGLNTERYFVSLRI